MSILWLTVSNACAMGVGALLVALTSRGRFPSPKRATIALYESGHISVTVRDEGGVHEARWTWAPEETREMAREWKAMADK